MTLKTNKTKPKNKPLGFTIVELLVVIVVIGILAAITIVSYTGIAKKANESTLQSDLATAKKQFALYYTEYGSYPTDVVSNCPTAPINDPKYCLKPSSNNTLSFSSGINGTTYNIRETNGSLAYAVSDTKAPISTVDVSASADWITIGSQTWAKSNLNVGTMITGVTNSTNNSTVEKYCYNNLEANCTTHGGLYQWNELMQYSTNEGAQGICPIGSHVPSDNDWKILEIQLGMTPSAADTTGWRGTDQGDQLKSSGSSGFNITFAGTRSYDGAFVNLSSSATLWSSSEYSNLANDRDFSPGLAGVAKGKIEKVYGAAVRCLAN